MFSNYIPLRWNRKTALACVLGLTFLVLYPCLFNGFTNWDDGSYLLDNPQVRSLSPANIAAIFSTLHSGLYKPLVFLSFATEYHFFGLNPFVYHLVNLLFHLGSCVLVFLLLERLSLGLPAAFAVALLFGIHPMHVESVAWVSERKDMLYAFFFLLSLLLYLRYRGRASRTAYWCAVAAYLLSLLAKPFGVALPVLLFLTDWLENRSRDRAFWLDKLPFLLLAGVFAGFAVFSVKQSGVLFDGDSFGFLDKLQLLSFSILFYLGRFFWPTGLSVLYPYPARNAAGAFPLIYTFAPLLLAVLCAAVVWLARKNRAVVYGSLFFLATLLPGLQWLPAAPSLAMDHYTYIPYIGLSLALYAAVSGYLRVLPGVPGRMACVLFAAAALLLGWQARARCLVWRDSVTLWTDMLSKHPKAMAYGNRASALIERGDYAAAMRDLEAALALRPDYYLAYANRAMVFAATGEQDKALSDLARAVELAPRNGGLRTKLGAMLLNLNRLSGARDELELAVQLSPADYKPHVFLGNLHMLSGCPNSALPEYELAARLGAPRELGVDASVLKLRALLESPAAAPGFDSRNCRENR